MFWPLRVRYIMGFLNSAACCDMTLGKHCTSFGCSVCQLHCWDFLQHLRLGNATRSPRQGTDKGWWRRRRAKIIFAQESTSSGSYMVFLFDSVRLMLGLMSYFRSVIKCSGQAAWSFLPGWSLKTSLQWCLCLARRRSDWFCVEVGKQEENRKKLLGDWKKKRDGPDDEMQAL